MLKTKIYILAFGILPLAGFADICCDLIPGEPLEGSQVCPGYFYPAEYQVSDCLDISVSADFIYWAASKQLNPIAFENTISDIGAVHTDVIIHRAGYRPGFKVGIGLGFPGWDHSIIGVEYLWWDHTTTQNHSAGANSFIVPLTGITADGASTQLKSKWRLSLNIAQLTFEHPFYMGKRLILTPGFGIKAFWYNIKQAIDFDLIGGGLGTERGHFKSWAVGPYAYANIKGLLCWDVYLLGKFGFLAPYQRHTKNSFQADFPLIGANQSDFELGSRKPYAFEPYMESALGLGWGRYFCNCNYHADIEITYDYFAGMFFFLTFIGGPLAKDYWMHGLTIKAQFDF